MNAKYCNKCKETCKKFKPQSPVASSIIKENSSSLAEKKHRDTQTPLSEKIFDYREIYRGYEETLLHSKDVRSAVLKLKHQVLLPTETHGTLMKSNWITKEIDKIFGKELTREMKDGN